ncbi:MAG TPA: DUF1622 domain-containing protein [Vicinamibacterales bacterium]|jgi:uncharacterized membrane protein
MEDLVRQWSGAAALFIETISVLIVTWGAIEAAYGLTKIIVAGRATHGARKIVWRRLGTWLLLGLEFELAADIVQTVISPEWADIGRLGAIAAIRTFLNYFLEKDLHEASDVEPSESQPGPPMSQPLPRIAHGTSE